jgi:two-component system aerobic respiration control sensor histidine kinase ArcB
MDQFSVNKSPESVLEEIEDILRSDLSTDLTYKTLLQKVISYYETIIGCMPGNVYWLDKHGKAIGCNQNVLTMLGLKSIDEFKGLGFEEMGHLGNWSADAIQSFKKDTLEVIATGISKLNVEEPPIPHSDGRIIYFLTHRVPLKDDKKNIIGVVGISIDITVRIQLEKDLQESKEKAEAANQAKTEFLENMRHDIRTPLTGIVGFAEIIKMESDSPHIKAYAENLVISSYALLDLLSEVLEATRVSSGEIPKLTKKFNLQKALQQIIDLHRAKAAQKNLSLSLDIDKSLPTFVIGDNVRIHRIVLELISNALNFTDKGFVKLSVTLAKRKEEKLILQIIVEDSGIGIPKERQQDIYIQFKRLTPSYQGIYKGAGLGLYIIKNFIDDLGGEMYLESEPGKGSRFTCLISLKEPLLDNDFGIDDDTYTNLDKPHEKSYTQEIKPPLLEVDKQAHHVLVVEDNTIAQTVAKSILKQMNCSADIAESGKKALDLWKANDYDLIFMDIGLPDMDGHEVTRHIRLQELTKNTHVPIIALTAHAGDENKKRCIDAGMNAVLIKPLTAKSCADIVDAFIPFRQKDAASVATPKLGIDLPDTEAELFYLDTYPFLDVDAGIKTTNSKEMLIEMLKLLAEGELQSDVLLLKEAFAQNNEEKVQNLAHKIKGGAVYVGTIRMKMACQYLERYWKAGHRELFGKLYEQTISVIEDTIKEINQWLIQQ